VYKTKATVVSESPTIFAVRNLAFHNPRLLNSGNCRVHTEECRYPRCFLKQFKLVNKIQPVRRHFRILNRFMLDMSLTDSTAKLQPSGSHENKIQTFLLQLDFVAYNIYILDQANFRLYEIEPCIRIQSSELSQYRLRFSHGTANYVYCWCSSMDSLISHKYITLYAHRKTHTNCLSVPRPIPEVAPTNKATILGRLLDALNAKFALRTSFKETISKTRTQIGDISMY